MLTKSHSYFNRIFAIMTTNKRIWTQLQTSFRAQSVHVLRVKQNMKISLQSIRSIRFKLQTRWTCYCYHHDQIYTHL